MRQATVARKTNETDIQLTLTLEGETSRIDTGCGFLDHMLELFARHGGFGLELSCKGDTRVDYHHTVEDIGIVLGEAFRQALGDKRGINRYGSFLLPMDEALVLVAVDLSGRTTCCCELQLPAPKVGDFDTELGEEFFLGFCRGGEFTLHLRQLAGKNTHHILEAAFKGFGRAMAIAVALDSRHPDTLPSTKGVL
ncbi:MAG TPA: imidazoleglycerol-phosphate dehydratase HisB [Candidatus Pygmaiobacter gallistercoris]|nr:imidazoleglycerol-phosphate dehydratase HisB [Candidatus Pygmaiobacter gallistercoris]